MASTMDSSSSVKPAALRGVIAIPSPFRPPGKANGLAPVHAGGEAADLGPICGRVLVPAAGLSRGGTYTARDPLALRPAVTGGLPSGTELRIEARQKVRLL